MNLCALYLSERGITEETAKLYRLECDSYLEPNKIHARLGRHLPKGVNEIIWIPVYAQDGTILFHIARVLPTITLPDGKTVRFVCPLGSDGAPYIPKVVHGLKHGQLLIITEGPIKAIACGQAGVAAIGLNGVWGTGAKNSKDEVLIRADLQNALDWRGRICYLGFDADFTINPDVRHAMFRNFFLLTISGAEVFQLQWDISQGKGLDDYLASQSNGERKAEDLLRDLLGAAKPFIETLDPTALNLAIVQSEFRHLKIPDLLREQLCKPLAVRLGVRIDDLRKIGVNTKKADVGPETGTTLFEQLSTEFGPPAHLDAKGQPSKINERFFAELIARENEIVHDADDQRFHLYNPKNGRWERTSAHALKKLLSSRIRQAEREWEACRGISKLDTEQNRRDIISLLRGVVEKTDFFVNRPHAIHAANCMLVFENGEVAQKPFGPEFRSRNQLTVTYDPEAECKKFETELINPALDADDRITIKKMFGLLVLGRNRPQRIFILTGPGNTGKTTVCLIAEGLVGQNNCAELRTNQLEGRFEMARLLNKTLVFGADVAANFLMTESAYRLKSIVGGDPLVGERKNSNEDFRFNGDINAIITANVRLLIKLHGDFDKSAWGRRLCPINFRREPLKKRIANFHEVLLKEEGSGILNWAIEGLLAYYKDEESKGDILLSQTQRERIEKLLSESDGLRTFITEELVEEEGKDLTSNEIVVEYAKYAKTKKWMIQSRRSIESMTQDLMLEVWGITQSNHVKRGDKKIRGYLGLRLRAESELDPDE
jgi:putative DNA primase/helicase